MKDLRKNHIIFKIVVILCCVAAARASVTGIGPLPGQLANGVLYMTVGMGGAEVSAQETEPEPETAAAADVEPPAPSSGVAAVRTVAASRPLAEGIEISNLAKAEVNVEELLSLPARPTGERC